MIVGQTRLPPTTTTTTTPSAIDSVRKIPKTLDTHSGVSFSRSDDSAAAAAAATVVVAGLYLLYILFTAQSESVRGLSHFNE